MLELLGDFIILTVAPVKKYLLLALILWIESLHASALLRGCGRVGA